MCVFPALELSSRQPVNKPQIRHKMSLSDADWNRDATLSQARLYDRFKNEMLPLVKQIVCHSQVGQIFGEIFQVLEHSTCIAKG
jgi:hypothetical protein